MGSPLPPTASDDFYRTLVENASEGMLTIDAESEIVYANPAIEDILGYPPDELIGSSKMKIIPERLQPVHASALASYVRTGDRNIDWDGIELPAQHKDGHEVPTLISLREHEYDGEQYFTGIVRDITERKRREEQLRDQKDRLDEFADILAHDIRNPLSVALGYADIAREKHDIPELESVSDSLSRIDALVDDVLALSKEGRSIGETETVAVEEAVRDSWRNVDTGRATLWVDPGVGTVEADESRFRELLENLFRNAVDHAGSDVTVRVGRTPDGDTLYVSDDGPGIPEDLRREVFEYGYSTSAGGTGYGLSIVARIAEAHGWDVSVTESDEGGACFEFAL
ncbi:PAS domain S-box protein [Halorubrum sp. CBA1125]|uniref:two-component system sensor histidine kinase NtrB n=1 Tax=Halorubrum sp. CBA1125 TaxID=2668072 RepID=UPI0012E901B8|nr:PAS domain-containing sensor histidine kinase [Halorubrum sp. CBA1125]MUW14046.1 PAS domain S-box protein [Halorubrum sp. CBA1125]